MQYRNDKYGEPISILGYGCMRFTKEGGHFDEEKAERELIEAVESGVNYFDTAYIYPGSEVLLGRIFEKNHCRKKVNIATKLPQYLIKSEAALDRYFNEQLSRLRTDYIDYYLMHMLTDIAAWEKLYGWVSKHGLKRKKQTDRYTASDFLFMEIRRCFLRSWTLTTGISARFSTIIWMSTHRPGDGGLRRRQREGSRSLSWSRSGAESLWSFCRNLRGRKSRQTLGIVLRQS